MQDLAYAAPCQNSQVLPSSVQIFQEIMVREPREKGRIRPLRTALLKLTLIKKKPSLFNMLRPRIYSLNQSFLSS